MRPGSEKWVLYDYKIREIDNLKEDLIFGDKMEINLDLLPNDFNINAHKVEIMNYKELNTFIDRERLRGSTLVNKPSKLVIKSLLLIRKPPSMVARFSSPERSSSPVA